MIVLFPAGLGTYRRECAFRRFKLYFLITTSGILSQDFLNDHALLSIEIVDQSMSDRRGMHFIL